ncbi:MAG: PHP domain-containing protein [Dehalococcoidales bacterium]|nr:PHP domain-containing protein [Dehalococcoidales bacterium]
MLKADLHIHTEYSPDSDTSLEKVIERCQEVGINCIAICDHNTAEGALKMQRIAPFRVIVAEEILTPHGEIMGMFLKETIPRGLSVEETIALIKQQGGLVSVPHPFDTIRVSALDPKVTKILAQQGKLDLIEVFNAKSLFPQYSARARRFAQRHNLPGSAGSDAHTADAIGNAYVEMPEFSGRDNFLEALAQGRVVGHRSSLFIYAKNILVKLRKQYQTEG